MKTLVYIVLAILCFTSQAQTFYSVKTIWSGEDSWKQWRIYTSEGEGVLKTVWSNNPYYWQYDLPFEQGKIETVWSDDDTQWRITSDNTQCRIRQVWSNDWHSWDIICDSVSIRLRTVWSDSLGWQQWHAIAANGQMDIRTRWTKDWTDWQIDDDLSANATAKIATIFIAIYIAHKKAKLQQK